MKRETSFDYEARSRRTKLGLGLRNGLLIGLALALGTWGLQAISPSLLHVRSLYPPLVLGALALLLLGGFGGLMTAWLGSSLAGLLIWTVVAILMAAVISRVPYDGHNLLAWLADRRFWGLPILPYDASAQAQLWLSGFFIVLLLVILGLLQDSRMDGVAAEVGPEGRLSGRGWFLLILPLPLVLGAGLIADNIVNSTLRAAPALVEEAIATGRTYRGDLFELSLEKGFNYNAIKGLRELMSEDYVLYIGEADVGAAETVAVVADFDNGVWIYCTVVAGNLSNCQNASLRYTQGFSALLANGEFPEDCLACRFGINDEVRNWLLARRANFDGAAQVRRLGQRGSYVLMEARSPGGDYGIECRFSGITWTELEECWEVEDLGSVGTGAVHLRRQDLRPSEAPPTVERAIDEGTGDPGPTKMSANQPRPKASAPNPEPTKPDSTDPKDTLALFAPAMRSEFADDLTSIGPVSGYRIEVTVDPDLEGAQVSGQETVRYVNNASVAQDAVYFRLFPNLPGYGGEMTVEDVRVEGMVAASSPETQGTALRVPLATALHPGEATTITLSFSTTVPITTGVGYGQFIHQNDVMALANFFPLIPAFDRENCARFGNCDGGWNIEYAVPMGDSVFSEVALFETFITAPQDWAVVASGSTVEQTDRSSGDQDGDLTWHIVGGPMRDFYMVLSPRFKVATRKVGDVTVNSYYLPEDAAGGRRVLRWAADALSFFDELFGPYPFSEFDVVATPTIAGGIEYPGLIVMPTSNYGSTEGRFQWATVHEVAHQWWYSLVGSDQQDEPWLDEALTQYSTALFYELHEGWNGAISEVFEPRYQAVAGTKEDDVISQPVAAYTESNYGPIVYQKGPLFFHALRQEVGDKVFYALLRSYFNNFRYKIASGRDLLSLAETTSERDLSELYRQWLGDVHDAE